MELPHPLLQLLTWGLFLLISWAVPWSVIGADCLPGGNLFGIIVLADICFIFGLLISKVSIPNLPPLPGLFGMLIGGFMLANTPGIDVATSISHDWSYSLRAIALSIILVKAGLDLDPSALNKTKGVCLRLTVIPCFIETACCGIVSFLLLGFPWGWGFLLGCVLGAVSPAVIVPSLLKFQEQGYGVAKGIPSLVIAACSFDDVLAISGFSVVFSIVFSNVVSVDDRSATTFNGTMTTMVTPTLLPNTSASSDTEEYHPSLAMTIVRGPLEMIGGVALSVVLGVALWYVPSNTQKEVVKLRSVLVMSIGVWAIFASGRFNVPGAGALIAIITPFVACMKWNQRDKAEISDNIGKLWIVFEPLMFGLIGAEVRLDKLDSSTVGLGIAALSICLIFRMIATYGAVTCAGFNWKEKLFLCFAWMPKATVQAAIGGVALDRARKIEAPQEIIDIASQVLTISVLSILITAPLGAVAIGLSGPKLLEIEQSVSKEDCELNEQERASLSPASAQDSDAEKSV